MQTLSSIKPAAALLGALVSAIALGADANTGLWVGSATVERINRAGPGSAAWDTTTNLPAANQFPFRVIVHVDTAGQARLLQRVLLTYSHNGARVTNAITGQVTTNGTYRLLTDESLVASARLADPQAEVTRISSVNFPLMPPQILNGTFGSSNQLNTIVTNLYDDPVNPFVHVFAPLHGNWLIQNGTKIKLGEGIESFTVIRNLFFQFADQDPSNPTNPKWGIDENGGDLKETIEGLYWPIQVQGRFRLQRLTTIGTLD